MKTNRRNFLKMGGLASASLFIPRWATGNGITQTSTNGRVLVIIQLDGGNDGLNTVIPYRNDLYYKSRPKLAIEASQVLGLNDQMGLHPSLVSLRNLYDDGALAVINSVGYDNPNRSHFRSSDIWHTASNANQYLNTGWLGGMLDEREHSVPHHVLEMNSSLSLALKGKRLKGLASKNPVALYRQTSDPLLSAVASSTSATSNSNLDYLHRTLQETTQSAQYLFDKSKVYSSTQTYPKSRLSQGLKTIAELIISESETAVYYVTQSGYDTHVGQSGKQKRLFTQYDEAVSAFTKDLKTNDRFKDVAILTYSEFGRRVTQNASGGTDHGAANCSWIIGENLRNAGIINGEPDLSNLHRGDIKHTVDFRQIYADLLDNWLKQDSKKILGSEYSGLSIV